ncbi:MAG: aminotransferase class V-fold PLP-dependent enzyme [Acidobacteriota bacterium]
MDREAAPRLDRSSFVERDAADPLGPQRRRFALPESVLYFDGNSLGPLPRSVPEALGRTAEREWGQDLIASWNAHGWIDLPARVGAKLAPLIGASPGEVLACDSVSVNLFKLLAAALGIQGPGRPVVVVQDDHFPTDLYIAQGLSSLIEERCEVRRASIDRLPEALDERVAAVCLSHVDFRTGRLEDMATLTEQIQRAGALAVWDLSHSAGALPVRLGECGVDMAVGCGYKFLCGGPGAPAFLHVAERHHQTARSPLWGWLGHR